MRRGVHIEDLPFSKQRQLRDRLTPAFNEAQEMIAGSAKLVKLKRLAKQMPGVTFGVEKSSTHTAMKGWISFPGKHYCMRSTWERNYARYLQFLRGHGQIKNWFYEPRRFDFPIKRGNNSYLPDFKVINKDGQVEWHEVKGHWSQGSLTKLKRFTQYYPGAGKLVIVDSDAYREISKQCRNLVPGWERC